METIKVKINKISNAADTAMIGKTLQIDNGCSGDTHFRIPYEGHDSYVLKSDCEIVTDTITVTADKIRAMANKSVEAWEMMKAGFPEAFEEDKSVDLTELLEYKSYGKITDISKLENYLFVCYPDDEKQKYSGKCFGLDNTFNWELKKSINNRITLLIPTKK